MAALAILGPGGVGAFVAAALARAGDDAVLVAREETAEALSHLGLHVESVLLGPFDARPRVAAALVESVDALLVATKAPGLPAALERIRVAPGLVVPLLNGIDHMAAVRERCGPGVPVAAGVIRIDAARPEVGRVVQSSPGARVDLAADNSTVQPALGALAQRLEQAGLEVRIGPSEAQVLWAKLVRLNAIACTTTAADRPLGEIREDPRWRRALEGCVREGVAAACAEGAQLEEAVVLAELDETHPTLRSSLWRDVRAGRASELDAIAGAVLRAAARHGQRCPTISALVARIEERVGHRATIDVHAP